MNNIIVVINRSNKESHIKTTSCNALFHSYYATNIIKTIKKSILYSFPDAITKSYPEIIEDWIANAPKMAVNLGDKFELENFRPTVAN